MSTPSATARREPSAYRRDTATWTAFGALFAFGVANAMVSGLYAANLVGRLLASRLAWVVSPLRPGWP